MIKHIFLSLAATTAILLLATFSLRAEVDSSSTKHEFSTAGFFAIEGTGREAFSMNPAWRFHRGDAEGAENPSFDDSGWDVVSLPHGIEYLPAEASGCINYRGPVWYRKHFTPIPLWQGRRTILHFEAIMGKCRVYVNGTLVKEHFGGYLPVVADVTDHLSYGDENIISVWADNTNDPTYPPGKEQENLDYTYCGGIYRDCWMVVHSTVHITDPNLENEVAGGGLFVAFGNVSDQSAEVILKAHVRNTLGKSFQGTVEYELKGEDGCLAGTLKKGVHIAAGEAYSIVGSIKVIEPALWSPSQPNLYNLYIRIKDSRGDVIDGYRRRIGIRSLEFRGAEGFFLNGKHYDKPLIGVNRHQDFAILGNAVPNSLHWRDAWKLKMLGLEVIRNSHCPQDPAFMDACDELGLFIIDNTPGWQFWNDEPVFEQRVYEDIRNLVRRDRSHACLWLWEPILNETGYPDHFARRANEIVHEEYPYNYCWCGSDASANGSELFPVLFAHPRKTVDGGNSFLPDKTYFTREWGDNVDDWSSHNSNSRASRIWGERPMLVQAQHYADLDLVTNFDILYSQTPQHIGGCLWHSFDHQRGYHPDPFYGGIMDNFRQPKYSYYMFMAQRPADTSTSRYGSGPMIHIAHEMTPFSDDDVTVYSNCDEVRLKYCSDGETMTYRREENREGMPSPIITFEGAYDFMKDKRLTMAGHGEDVFLLAEGLIDGKVVVSEKKTPSRRPEKILVWADSDGVELKADGSDCVVIIAAVADKEGNIKRLSNERIIFQIEGEGRLLGDASIDTNPVPVHWGTAPIILQSTTKAGKVKIKASILYQGSEKAVSGELELETLPADHSMIFDDSEVSNIQNSFDTGCLPFFHGAKTSGGTTSIEEVGLQQKLFGE